MRLITTFALAVFLAVTLSAADIAGTWRGTVETQMGAVELTFNIQEGPGVNGDLKSEMVEGKLVNGKLEGSNISFQVESNYGTLGFEGTVSGDEMKLTMTGTTGNKYPLVLKRQK